LTKIRVMHSQKHVDCHVCIAANCPSEGPIGVV
jgi:hypothetical protein